MMVMYDGEPLNEDEGLTQLSCKVADWAQEAVKSNTNLKTKTRSKFQETPEPSFSIGLPQLENEEQDKIDAEGGKAVNRRRLKLAGSKKSPFIERVVNIEKHPSNLELKVWCYLVKDSENQKPDDSEATEEQREVEKEFRDEVFETKQGYITKRFLLRSLEPYETVLNNVVDCWAIVLNYDETKRAPDSPYRLFMTTGVISNVMLTNKKLKSNDCLALFKENIKSVLYVENIDKEMLIVDIVMFPILEKGHYYLVCFDLKEGTIEILDNMETSYVGVADAKSFLKKDTAVKVKDIFVMYLEHIGHKRCNGIRMAKLEKKLEWSTKNNSVDCGVFLTWHMETYMGSKVRKWKCGLVEICSFCSRENERLATFRLKMIHKGLASRAQTNSNDKAVIGTS